MKTASFFLGLLMSVATGILVSAGCAAPTTTKAGIYQVWPFDAKEAARRQDETARALRVPKEITLDLGNGKSMKLVLVPAGKFSMGSTEQEQKAAMKAAKDAQMPAEDDEVVNEGPQHEVTISKPFYISVHDVTQEQYKQVTGDNPSESEGATNPVELVSWDDAVEFCKILSKKTGRKAALPTEAQWEYACRAGTNTPFNLGESITLDQANLDFEYLYRTEKNKELLGNKTAPAGKYKPNAFGIYDMHGNVQQWCADLYGKDYYAKSPKVDPPGPATGTHRVTRGGSWVSHIPALCRSALRDKEEPGCHSNDIGFRIVVEPTAAGSQPQSAIQTTQASPDGVIKNMATTSIAPGEKPSTSAASLPTTRPTKTYTAWPFDAKEAARRQDETAKALGLPKELTLDLGNKVSMKLTLIPAGKFVMGSPKNEKERYPYAQETQHEVIISKPFYMGIYEVTQEQYEQITGKNPSRFKEANSPVAYVSWNEAMEFCKQLAQKTGRTVTLPTEAQWEYACRAGTATPYNTGQTISTDQANYNGRNIYGNMEGKYLGKATPVGTFKPNAFGLYDMHGNVSEFCSDLYDESDYGNSPKTDPQGSANGAWRIRRGGGWNDYWGYCRSAWRGETVPGFRSYSDGLRVVVAPHWN